MSYSYTKYKKPRNPHIPKNKKHPDIVKASIINGKVYPTNAADNQAIKAHIDIPFAGTKLAISIQEHEPNEKL